MIKRCDFIALLGGAAGLSTAWPAISQALEPAPLRRIGVIPNGSANDSVLQSGVAAFEQRLRTLGWSNGGNLHIDYRWYTGSVEQTNADVDALTALAPDLIVSSSSTVL